jgi:hypothetical protein
MSLKERANDPANNQPRWVTFCIVMGLVVGAGGLMPSLFSRSEWAPVGETAAKSGSETSADLPPTPSPAAMLGRLAAGTILVLALCAGTLPLMKRWLVAAPTTKPGGAFEVIATLPLNGRCCVCLVKAGGQHLLAAMDTAGLQVLVPVGDVPADGELPFPEAPRERRLPAGIEPRRLTAV